MYVWIWRHLPGGIPGKLLGCLLLLAGVLALLFYLLFPWAETRLPFNDVTINNSHSTSTSTSTSTPSPSPTPSRP
jgi:hypothetical protein